jgi:hypothetical protein
MEGPMATARRLFYYFFLFGSINAFCWAGDSWCSSASAKVAIGDHSPGFPEFFKPFVQFFDVSTTLSPGAEATKVKAGTINVNIEIWVTRTWEDAADAGHAEQEKRVLRAPLVPWGTSKSRLKAEFHPMTTGIRRVSVKDVTCDNLTNPKGASR